MPMGEWMLWRNLHCKLKDWRLCPSVPGAWRMACFMWGMRVFCELT